MGLDFLFILGQIDFVYKVHIDDFAEKNRISELRKA